MPNDPVAVQKKREMDQWLATLDPRLRTQFDAAFDSNEAASEAYLARVADLESRGFLDATAG